MMGSENLSCRALLLTAMDGLITIVKTANGKHCFGRYEPGQFYRPHYDYFSDEVRFLFEDHYNHFQHMFIFYIFLRS